MRVSLLSLLAFTALAAAQPEVGSPPVEPAAPATEGDAKPPATEAGPATTEEAGDVVVAEEGLFFYESANFDFEAEHHRGNECDRNGEGCPEDRWCDTDTRLCWPKREAGERCNDDKKCLSECCVDNLCTAHEVDQCAGVECPTGQLCDDQSGQCYVDLCSAVPCEPDYYCDHGNCLEEEGCQTDPDCPTQYYCDDQTDTCIWIPNCNVDDECNAGETCRHGNCIRDDELRANGEECQVHAQCESGFCDRFAFEHSTTNNPDGVCAKKKVNGAGCEDNFECISNLCVDNECTDVVPCTTDNQCAANEFCDILGTRQCQDKIANREECTRNGQCVSGFCDRFVFEDSNTNNPQLCRAKKANGQGCDANFECLSGACVDFECQSRLFCDGEEDCTSSSQYCNLEDNECQLKLSNGSSCTGNFQCQSDLCSNNICRAEPFCASDIQCTNLQFCNLADNTCDLKLANRERCTGNNQCISGYCAQFGDTNVSLCQAKKEDGQSCEENFECISNTCFNDVCTSRLPTGDPCTLDTQCASGFCSCETNRCVAALKAVGGSCEESCECRSGLHCDAGDEGHDNTCKVDVALGEHCHSDDWCRSGKCHVFACAWGLCGTETCVPIEGATGDYCVSDVHCASNRCRGPRGGRSCRGEAVSRLGGPWYGW